MSLSHVNNLLKLKLLNPRSPLAGGGGGGGKGATYFWVGKQEELWEMRKWRRGTYSCETGHLCVYVFFFFCDAWE